MICAEVRQHWMLYLDSEGNAVLHLHINEHLAECPACAEWFERRRRLERAVQSRLSTGRPTPELWDRVLSGAGALPRPGRLRRLAWGGALAAAALLAVALGLFARSAAAPHLSREAAGLHDRWLHGEVRPEFASHSDHEVDRFLKAWAPFPVHCPPRGDVDFAVRGAGFCTMCDRPGAFIVGEVEESPVTIVVLDRGSLTAFPRDEGRLRDGHHHRCREGNFDMVSGLVADNIVIVTGTAPPEALEKLLDAYGTYPDG
jgi:hypothetical protein